MADEFYEGWRIKVDRYPHGHFHAVWQYTAYPDSEICGLTHELDFSSAEHFSEAAVIERIKLHLEGVFPFSPEEQTLRLPAAASFGAMTTPTT